MKRQVWGWDVGKMVSSTILLWKGSFRKLDEGKLSQNLSLVPFTPQVPKNDLLWQLCRVKAH